MASSRLSWFAVLLALTAFESVEGYSFVPARKSIPSSQKHSLGGIATDPTASSSASGRRIRRTGSGSLNMYLPPETSTQTAPMVAQRILKAPPSHTGRKSDRRPTSLSNSVLAASDTLPSFPTAHGLLSPEIVQRMDEMTAAASAPRSAPLVRFLDTYRNYGPMACLPMLSDPGVLPKLTEAMRDIA